MVQCTTEVSHPFAPGITAFEGSIHHNIRMTLLLSVERTLTLIQASPSGAVQLFE